ncbi:RNA polymerase sigma factor [Evansella clarkii]|jgi:RNA polymerase sigma-70 factor (ECF subfamily)|uniref:RNA polymerase sigma factor n=1 Tax=Evansella clarkii TaxID=79879 RepID=UPI000996D90B|nr:sigma-70 family RNA polymerase sigma factor [Evansella clarkii]
MKEGIEEVYKLYFHDIYRYLLFLCHDHYVAEDLVQDTFYRAYLYLENYRGERVKTWLFTVAHNAYIDYHRKQKRNVVKDLNFFFSQPDKKKTAEEHLIIKEEIQEVITDLKELPEKQRGAVLLHDFHELSYKEAAGIMGITVAHFKVALFRGRQTIRKRKAEEK